VIAMSDAKSTAADRKPPPFRPDPELMWNLHGNAKQAAKDAEEVREYLRQLDEAEARESMSEG
jgi:hypothetical protein